MAGFLRASGIAAVALVCVALLGIATSPPAEAVGGEGEGWPSFNESDGCGSPWMIGPRTTRTGWVPGSTIIRGPYADYFGRTIDQVWDSLAWWDVPMSNNESIRLHERLQPALAEVEVNLAQAASDGYLYNIVDRYTFGYAARTIGGSYRISQHALGNAIDINSTSNPYTTGMLRTNMPSWFVDSFSDAGFCWGGYWISVKDAMHYSWRGPNFTESITELPDSYPPTTSSQGFTRVMYQDTVPGELDTTAFRIVMDGNGNGAPDIVNVSSTATAAAIDVVSSTYGYQACGVSRYPIESIGGAVAAVNGDWDRDGSQDVWIIGDDGGLTITAHLRFGDFEESEAINLAADPGDHYLAADFDVDGWTDFYIIRVTDGTATVTVLDGESRFASVLVEATLPHADGARYTALDRDLDHVPDLMMVAPSGSTIVFGATGYSSSESVPGFAGTFDDIAGADFDGDGRHDLVLLDGESLTVAAGNSPLSVSVTSWFEYPSYTCSPTSLPYPYSGTFRDDDSSTHGLDIEAIADVGITKGCNPPLNDEFCPRDSITRGQLAAFIRRSLGLPAAATNTYSDIAGNLFEGDISALAAAGIVVPCPGNDSAFCPDEPVLRDDMARFLVAAFDIPSSDVDAFIDDDGNPFESAIDDIAAVGVTKGCNPPDNTEFCPEREVTRAEMASFLIRALRMIGS